MLRFFKATVVGFLFAGAMPANAAAARTCDASIFPDCSALSSAPLDARGQLGFGTPRDGGAIFNSQAYWSALDSKDAKVRKAVADAEEKLATPSPARESIARATTLKIRDEAVDFLKLRLPDSPERALLISRLNSITIDTTSNPPDTCGQDAVPKGFPNLGYSAHTNTLYLCTPATNVTERQLIRALTHELGHVISPCMAQSKQYTVDKDQLYRGPLVECSNDLYYDDAGNQTGPDDTISMLMSYQPEKIVEHQLDSSEQKLANCKIIKEIPNSSVASSEVFSETKSCLLKKFRPSLEQSDAFKLARMNGKTPAQAAAQLHASSDDVCADDVDEAFADSFSAAFLGQIAFEKNWSETDMQVAVLNEAGFNCYEKSHSRASLSKYELASMRIKAELNDPQTASRLHCEIPKDPNLCPLKFSNSAGAKQNTTPKPPATKKPAVK